MGTERNAAPDGVGAAVAASASGPYAIRFVAVLEHDVRDLGRARRDVLEQVIDRRAA